MIGNKFCFYRADVNPNFPVHNGFGNPVPDGEQLVLEVDGVMLQDDAPLFLCAIGRYRHPGPQRRSFHLLQKKLVRFLN